jgi:hypothetical protein
MNDGDWVESCTALGRTSRRSLGNCNLDSGEAMMWLLILIAVHINDPADNREGWNLNSRTKKPAASAEFTMTWQLKFESFKVVGECKKQS